MLQMVWEDIDKHDRYVVAITRGGCIVGNIAIKRDIENMFIFLPSKHLFKLTILAPNI